MTEARDTQEHRAALNFEFDLDAPPAKVWRAMTVPDFVARWLPARPASAETAVPETAVPSTAVRSTGGPATTAPLPALLRVLDQEPGRWVRYSWQEAHHDGPDSVVTFRLDPNGAGGTRLRIAHVLAAAVGPPARQTAANSNTPLLLLRAA